MNNSIANLRLNNAGTAHGVIGNLFAEGGDDFYNYVNRRGLINDPNLIVLSFVHHYYYDSDEMNNIKTIINLKELNKIKKIKSFLQSHLYSMPPRCNFVGFFANNAKVNRYALRYSSSLLLNMKKSEDVENGIISRFPVINMIYGLMDWKTNRYMSESGVTMLLKEFGFTVLDMTEINGRTYFHSQKAGGFYN
jgi:Na+/H+ antiporter NhaD/arsenite permease-like protein